MLYPVEWDVQIGERARYQIQEEDPVHNLSSQHGCHFHKTCIEYIAGFYFEVTYSGIYHISNYCMVIATFKYVMGPGLFKGQIMQRTLYTG